jgi:hypothetical protein
MIKTKTKKQSGGFIPKIHFSQINSEKSRRKTIKSRRKTIKSRRKTIKSRRKTIKSKKN